jgi:SAM-dependent methyltransferase
MEHFLCPNCDGNHIEVFFKIQNAPIFSMVTKKTKEEALRVPRKDIELGFCHNCGFIFNRSYDPSIDYFSMGYEDQQGFSKTFMQYIQRLSKELIEKHDLQGKTIVEIGCGKGDFINLIVELAGGKGIGIDPAYEEGRQKNANLSFYKEIYKLDHGRIQSELICCRHTLEHVHQPRKFLQLIRKSFGTDRKPIVFFEIPEMNRILDIQAFWDIYYEHCSYFNASSLAYLFKTTGFEILDIRLDYNDQYLLIEAIPTQHHSDKIFEIEESIEYQKTRVDAFTTKIEEQLGFWRRQLQRLKAQRKKTVIWGGGSKAVGFLTNFDDLNLIDYVVDINPHMENNYIPGIGSQYVQPGFLKEYNPDDVIIMNGVYAAEITKTLNTMGIQPKVHTL